MNADVPWEVRMRDPTYAAAFEKRFTKACEVWMEADRKRRHRRLSFRVLWLRILDWSGLQ